MKIFKDFDWLFLGLILFVLLLGLPVLLSVARDEFNRQLVWILAGLLGFFLFSALDYRFFENFPHFLYFLSLAFLLITFLFGQTTRGAIRWLNLGLFNLQASEIIKPLLILSFASWGSRLDLRVVRNLIFLFLLISLVSFLVFLQPDLGSALVIAFVSISIIFLAGLNFKFFLLLSFLFGTFLPLFWRFLKSYQKDRILVFFQPYADPLGKGYHLLQAIIAIGSGKFFGQGLGRGTQSHLRFLPEYHTDFIFASLAEELGFVGSLLVLIAFWSLLWRILVIAQKSGDKFGSLICFGVFAFIFSQVFINIGMNMGLLPITGVPLPLVSYGGSSLLTTLISLGLVSSVAKFNRPQDFLEIR